MNKAAMVGLVASLAIVLAALAGPLAVRQDSPKDVVESFIRIQAAGDWDAAALVTHPDHREPVAVVGDGMKRLIAKCRELADAVEAAYGKQLADEIRGPLQLVGMDPALAAVLVDGKVDFSKVKIEQAGPNATATVAGREHPLRLAQVGATWYIVPRGVEGRTAEQALAEANVARAQFARSVIRLEALIRLVKAKELTEEQFAEQFAKAMPGDGDAPPTAQAGPAPIAVRHDTPEQVVETVLRAMAALDFGVLAAVVAPDYQPAMRTVGGSMTRLISALSELARLVEARLGAEHGRLVAGAIDGFRNPAAAGAIKDGRIDWSQITIQARGDSGLVTVAGEDDPLRLVRVGGKWYTVPFDADDTLPQVNEQAEMVAKHVAEQLARLGELGKRVEAGQVKAEDFGAEFSKAITGQQAGEP